MEREVYAGMEEGGRQAALDGDRKPEVKWKQLRCELKVFGSFDWRKLQSGMGI